VVTGGARASAMPLPGPRPEAGAAVTLIDLEQTSVEAAAAKLRSRVDRRRGAAEICDVSSYEQVWRRREALEARWGSTDTLVNNAGIAYHAPAETMSVAEWDRMLQVNLSGVFYCSQVFGVAMIAAGSGAIVNIASMSGLIVSTAPQPPGGLQRGQAG